MLFDLGWLATIFTDTKGEINTHIEIDNVIIDSRDVRQNSLFIPIVGERFNGHAFVEQAIANGAAAVIWGKEEKLPTSVPSDFPIFYTEDTTVALQTLAKAYRDFIQPIVVGITGSNGKTTTKDLVAAIGKSTYKTHYTSGNFNNLIGLPLTILSMPQQTELLILEMGMDRFGEIEALSNIARPDYAIITNIGESHIEFLGSREGITKAKLEIISGMKRSGVLIVDGDEPMLEQLHMDKIISIYNVGFAEHNDLQIKDTIVSMDGTSFHVNQTSKYEIPLIGKHHAKNAAFAIALANQLKIDPEKQKNALQDLEHTPMRFEVLEGKNQSTIVNDSYNASPTSMAGAIGVMKQIDGFTHRILVLGDILELGSFSEEMHRLIANEITPPITHVFTYGQQANFIHEEMNLKKSQIISKHMADKEEIVKDLNELLNEDTIVLFKASRGMQFETMVEAIIIDEK
ncbi:UDP-N-acetylmuramoyl-tripeptide--D-alanyl-D-alanine ligase [Oceanobacillus sp. CAU 1775]